MIDLKVKIRYYNLDRKWCYISIRKENEYGDYMSSIYLKTPSIEDLYYRKEWMKDPKTMSYNAWYDMELKGYDKNTGTITKTDEEMINWYNNWIDKEPDKYFAYIYDKTIY